MPHSHHSHSGEFCNHAVDQLEEVVLEAIRQGMRTYALTEHMPRDNEADLYPGEAETGWSLVEQALIYDSFYHKARRLQTQYKGQIELLVGLEIDWIRPTSKDWINQLLQKYSLDLFVGSIHHVHGIPIDYDEEHYRRAIQASAELSSMELPAEQILFEDYFDDQYAMLQALNPPVIGHFDLIRLLSEKKNENWTNYPRIWEKICRNLDYVYSYGGILELNSAGLRKGLMEPYPKLEVCQYFKNIGGRFVLSDDSHGIKQIGHSYEGLLQHARRAGLEELAVFTRTNDGPEFDSRFLGVHVVNLSLETVHHQFPTNKH